MKTWYNQTETKRLVIGPVVLKFLRTEDLLLRKSAMIKKQSNVTLKTVALYANCSTAVASTVLNGSRGNTKVSEEMREHVLAVARELDYYPNYASRNLKSGRSQTLGIYVQTKEWRGLSFDYEMSIFKGIEHTARELGYDLLALNISSGNLPKICADRLREKRIDGVILIHCDPDADWIDELLDISSNVIAIDYNQPHPRLNQIGFDNHAAIRLAITHLHDLGHRRIGFAGSCLAEPQYDSVLREKAFLELTAKLGTDSDPKLLFHTANCPVTVSEQERFCQREGCEALNYFSTLADPPTAIITYNSLVGIALLKTAQEKKIGIPEKFSVIGIDSSEMIEYISPRLTVVDHALCEMGAAAAAALIERLDHPQAAAEPIHRLLQPKLISGGSTSCIV